eukprot:m.64767 g.64767  ORF g.64767 m.64767 type:complete len:193 (-) comp49746_c0_seq1:102-680(-)
MSTITPVMRKLVVIGDGACGKTCLLVVQTEKKFPEAYIPTVFENYAATVEFEGQSVDLALWDTAGQEDYAHIRPLSYADAHVILICFAVDNRDSFDNVDAKWIPEMKEYCPTVPFLIVGLKTDLRTDPAAIQRLSAKGVSFISATEGTVLAQGVKAFSYVECSAKKMENVSDCFYEAVRATQAKPKGCCVLM